MPRCLFIYVYVINWLFGMVATSVSV